MALLFCLCLAVLVSVTRADLPQLSSINPSTTNNLGFEYLRIFLPQQEWAIDATVQFWVNYLNGPNMVYGDVVSSCITNSFVYPCPVVKVVAGEQSISCFFPLVFEYGSMADGTPITVYGAKPSLCTGSVPTTCIGDNCENERKLFSENTPFSMYMGPLLAELSSSMWNVFCPIGGYCVAAIRGTAEALADFSNP